jgi:hypothetical protein
MLSKAELARRLGDLERSLACFLGAPDDAEGHCTLLNEKLLGLRADIENDPWNLWQSAVECFGDTLLTYRRRRQRPQHVTVMLHLLAAAARNALCWQKVVDENPSSRLN